MQYSRVEICGVNTAKLKVLKEAEKVELLKKIKATDDKKARQQLIEGNLRLVLSVVQRFANRGENPDDLFQVGCIGLIKAIDNFDISHEVRFSTYAVPMIDVRRNRKKGYFSMTRKTALNQAIYILSQTKGNEEIIEKLQDISDELPLIHWSDKSIRDRVEQFIEDEGRTPTVSDFRKKGMPPHTVFKKKYNINLAEWLNQNYPTTRPTAEEITNSYIEEFISEYKRIKPRSANEYETKRNKGVKSWQTVRSRCGQTSWRGLIKHLDLPFYFDMQKDHVPLKFNIKVLTDMDELNNKT